MIIYKIATIDELQDILDIEASLDKRILPITSIESNLKDDLHKYIIAYVDKHPVAYIALSFNIDFADLLSLAVKSNYRRQKIASNLLLQAFKLCDSNNINKILLEVNEHNHPAIMLYKSLGFNHISTRSNYYNGKDSAYVLCKEK